MPEDEPTPPEPSRTGTSRFRWALALLVLNYALGWPVIALAAALTPWIGVRTAALVGSGSYALSWALLGAAVLLGGREVLVYGDRWRRERRSKFTAGSDTTTE